MSTTQNPILPQPPYQTPISDQRGQMSVAWAKWVGQLFLRVGQFNAPPNTDIGTSQSAITTLQNEVATLQTSVTSLNNNVATINSDISSLTNQVNGLSVGRQL